jgi:hypothetical protein
MATRWLWVFRIGGFSLKPVRADVQATYGASTYSASVAGEEQAILRLEQTWLDRQ